uniref:Uncharacterized protein n=1 Tax=Coccolithus braarudii TaxID=221442 RepID=A0A7S0L751_9EUKA|mmetsp:Transcript_23973/g.51707  ORF Transcript_23973/g.51707 Transcript_23973/m.51707 type:complete len:198 (+) Transcript_23973:135-728(+)
MLSAFDINNVDVNQIDAALLASIQCAVLSVAAPRVNRKDGSTALNDCSVEKLRRQLPGSMAQLNDKYWWCFPPKITFRVPTGGGELQIRVPTTGKESGCSWKSLSTVTTSVEAMAWDCCKSNGNAGVFAAELKLGGQPVSIRPDTSQATIQHLLVRIDGCAASNLEVATVDLGGIKIRSGACRYALGWLVDRLRKNS